MEGTSTAGDAVAVVARTLQDRPIPRTSAADLPEALRRAAPLTVVLDDADLLLTAIRPLVAEWAALPGVRILVTSRAALGVRGEVTLALEPLDPADDPTGPAGQLLETRVRERQPDFVLPPSAVWVRPLLRALGGLPHLLELAAPWLAVMSGEDLLDHVERDLSALAGPAQPSASPRHRSVSASLGWAWALLSEAERDALVDSSVFAAPFDLRAARAVLAEPASGAPPAHELLLGLVERSWLRVSASPRARPGRSSPGSRRTEPS
jgi:predicted ATPase